MGANSRRRRDQKQRRAARQRAGRGRAAGTGDPRKERATPPPPAFDSAEVYAELERSLRGILMVLESIKIDDQWLRQRIEDAMHRVPPGADHVFLELVGHTLSNLLARLRDGGWSDQDLRELVRRRDSRQLAAFRRLLDGDMHLADGSHDVARLLRLISLLRRVPVLTSGAHQPRGDDSRRPSENPKLRQVRALLVKAESTSFPEEAEALMAKAQELIARHSLGRLLENGDDDEDGETVVRRLWLDAPYVHAKGALVDEVGKANSCRTAIDLKHGFCVVVGAPGDIDAVELLVTSLLVQANRAMLQHGRRTDWQGRSRTRAFRQSFLVAFAVRVGERLRNATERVAAEDEGRLLPVLRGQQERVRRAFDDLVPHVRGEAARAVDDEGWTAGVVAADLANLDVRRQVQRPAG